MIFHPSKNTYDNMVVLGLKKYPFSAEELTTAFRALAKKHHSDTGDGDKKMMREVIEAKKALENLVLENVDKVETKGKAPEGLTETCTKCNGTCVEKHIGTFVEEKCTSPECNDGKVTLKCRFCNNGRFRLKTGIKVACKACEGSGVWRVVNCRECKGKGVKTGRKDITSMCKKCNGHGKTKKTVFNPVIPEGAILAFRAGAKSE